MERTSLASCENLVTLDSTASSSSLSASEARDLRNQLTEATRADPINSAVIADVLQRARSATDLPLTAEAGNALALVLLNQRRHEDAAPVIHQAVLDAEASGRLSLSVVAGLRRVRWLREQRQLPEAHSELDRLAARVTSRPELAWFEGLVLAQRAQLNSAERNFDVAAHHMTLASRHLDARDPYAPYALWVHTQRAEFEQEANRPSAVATTREVWLRARDLLGPDAEITLQAAATLAVALLDRNSADSEAASLIWVLLRPARVGVNQVGLQTHCKIGPVNALVWA